MSKQLILAGVLLTLGTHTLAAEKLRPIEPPMVEIKGGQFMMGHLRRDNSQPVHAVTIKPFRMGKYEVTAEEFLRFVQMTGYQVPATCNVFNEQKVWSAHLPNNQDQSLPRLSRSKFEPVACIGPAGADAYVKWLAKETGKQYRLPTEAEWEYAHRAGSDTRYFFGNDESLTCRYANLADRSAAATLMSEIGSNASHVGVMPCDDKAGYATIVGMYEPNAFGLYDTLGNIAEYVQDCGRDDYQGAPADGSAVAGDCSKRVIRGGSWHFRSPHASQRLVVPPFVGFLEGLRVAQTIGTDTATPAAAPSEFEIALAQAQQADRVRRNALVEIKPAP